MHGLFLLGKLYLSDFWPVLFCSGHQIEHISRDILRLKTGVRDVIFKISNDVKQLKPFSIEIFLLLVASLILFSLT
jgi:hypothetical protein